MKNGKNDARQKKKSKFSAINVPKHLQAARFALMAAVECDEDLEKFTVELSGHKLTLEELHKWLIAVIEQYEKNGPRAEALKIVHDRLRSQFHPDLQ